MTRIGGRSPPHKVLHKLWDAAQHIGEPSSTGHATVPAGQPSPPTWVIAYNGNVDNALNKNTKTKRWFRFGINGDKNVADFWGWDV